MTLNVSSESSPPAGDLPRPAAYDDRHMLRFMLARLFSVAIALVVTSWIIDDLSITGGPIVVLGVAALFGIVTAILGPVLRLLTLPINVVTLGLFTFVVDAILLAIVAGLTSHLQVGGFLSTIVAALVLSIVAGLSDLILGRAFFRGRDKAR
jgi:putative membrane protein